MAQKAREPCVRQCAPRACEGSESEVACHHGHSRLLVPMRPAGPLPRHIVLEQRHHLLLDEGVDLLEGMVKLMQEHREQVRQKTEDNAETPFQVHIVFGTGIRQELPETMNETAYRRVRTEDVLVAERDRRHAGQGGRSLPRTEALLEPSPTLLGKGLDAALCGGELPRQVPQKIDDNSAGRHDVQVVVLHMIHQHLCSR